MRNFSFLDWPRFMVTPNEYRLSRTITDKEEINRLDFQRVMVSISFLTTVPDATAAIKNETVIFRWTNNGGIGNAESEEIAMPLIYNKERKIAIYDMDTATRADTYTQMNLPQEWSGNTLIFYLSFRNANGKEVSNSIKL